MHVAYDNGKSAGAFNFDFRDVDAICDALRTSAVEAGERCMQELAEDAPLVAMECARTA